ncbi:hypothetical protein KP509_26G034000 [Ceratopteris richardii]|uniref:Uncharacterized protein n=1 Tax=Ceratopteris richardii TaxID=49495 RepID=A0A8T2RL55_CERRI|nr:hypothetical protein KP509_26G034000 [Ceratopteris richardii]
MGSKAYILHWASGLFHLAILLGMQANHILSRSVVGSLGAPECGTACDRITEKRMFGGVAAIARSACTGHGKDSAEDEEEEIEDKGYDENQKFDGLKGNDHEIRLLGAKQPRKLEKEKGAEGSCKSTYMVAYNKALDASHKLRIDNLTDVNAEDSVIFGGDEDDE